MQILRVVLLISAGALLAGCGADGEPIQPTMSANIGVGSSGTYGGVGVGLRRGGVGVFLGL
ncbi:MULTISPECIES: hypothetical protein [Ruegeria]|uniref:hypothetical protein n=1 Tax=Ruegeria TaxID=97050 RepID=UPI00071DB1B5|nr:MULTISPECIES: hypothetical protein [Ruegeria]